MVSGLGAKQQMGTETSHWRMEARRACRALALAWEASLAPSPSHPSSKQVFRTP